MSVHSQGWEHIFKTLNELQLRFDKFGEYNGEWWFITRDHHDLFMMEEPFTSLTLLINFTSSQYIVRVFDKTRKKGDFCSDEELEEIIVSVFSGTVTCVGNPSLRGRDSVIEISHPFPMVVSPNCPGYYRLAPGEIVLRGRGQCIHCKQEGHSDIDFVSSYFDSELAAIYQEEAENGTRPSSHLHLASGSYFPVHPDVEDSIDFVSSYCDSKLTAIYEEEAKNQNRSSTLLQLVSGSDAEVWHGGSYEERLESHMKIEGSVIRISTKSQNYYSQQPKLKY